MSGRRRFRSSWTFMEGFVEANEVQGRIVGTNLTDWTVNVVSVFDRTRYFGIQVGSPYLHYSNGEGIYAFPEVGAKCVVTIPSDSSPPYVSSFIMPMERVDIGSDENPNGTNPQNLPPNKPVAASFSGGRPKAKPGDIWLRGRDNNFVILHRGGVLQIGCSEICQSIYVPLNHLWMNFSKNYAHHNHGGSVLWGIQEGPSKTDLPTEYTHTFRLLANTDAADVRIRVGTVHDPVPEPGGDEGEQNSVSLLELDQSQVVMEMLIAPQLVDADTGDTTSADVRRSYALKAFFTKNGGGLVSLKSSLYVVSRKRVRLRSYETMELISEDDMVLKAKNGLTLDGGAFTQIKGKSVKLGKGSQPVAHQGSMVQVTIPFTPIPGPTVPFVLTGTVTSGEPTVLV